jgi:GNAT superfamily N-acetyltransferase
MEGNIAVYDCRTKKEEIQRVAEVLQRPDQFNQNVRPWEDGCEGGERYHFVYRENGQIQGWMMVDILTHKGKWTYAYLDKVSARNGTKGVGKQLGDYLKDWARARGNIDFIWLWAKNRPVSDIYEKVWGYKRVQYYEEYGFMYFPIKKNPPLSLIQQELPENPRIYWVGADAIAKMSNPPNNLLLERISQNRRGDVEPVRVILANLMDELPNLDEEGVKDVQDQLIKALPPKPQGGGKTARNTHRLRFFRKHHLSVRGYSLGELSKVSKVSRPILQQVYDRGIGAYKTNPTSVRMKGTFKKGVKAPYSKKLSKEQWAMARVYSFLDGNPKHDTDLRRKTRRNRK